MKAKLKRVAKALIAVVVVVGLLLATRSAINQWNDQRAVALERVAELQQTLSLEDSPGRRVALQAELTRAQERVPELSRLRWSLIALAGLLYLLGLIPGGFVLHEAARVMGYRIGLRDAVSAQVVGHLGKYVPGKAMVVVIRAGRLSGLGVPLLAGSVAVFLETLLMMAVGAAVAGGLVFLLPVDRWIAWTALVGGIAATLPTLPAILNVLVRKIGLNRPPDSLENDVRTDSADLLGAIRPDWRFFVMAWTWQITAWILIGAAFACLVESIPGRATDYPASIRLAAAVASIALAMVVGFASLLPGGAGVRELTLALVLSPVVGASQALMAAIMARFLFIGVELLCAAVVTLVGRIRSRTCRGD